MVEINQYSPDLASPLHLDRWLSAWRSLTAMPPPEALYYSLLACYREPHRAYHTLQHLGECLSLLDSVRDLCQYPDEVALALWFHDAIYDTARHDNEQQSADWLAREAQALQVPAASTDRMVNLVLATRHDAQPSAGDVQLLVDIDLAILGANETRFAEYEQQVRQEYHWVPDAMFRQKRAAILEAFLARRPLYATQAMQARLEMAARRNLNASMTALATSANS